MAGEVSFIAWLIFNVALVIPASILIFYTMNTLFPVLAAVEDLDAPIYESLNLGQAVDEAADDSPSRQDKADPKPRAVSFSLRSMVRLLYSIRKCFSFSRGMGWILLWNIVKTLALVAAFHLPSVLGFLIQAVSPLAFIQIHTLWVHKIITPPSPKPFWRRLVPFRQIFRAVALPMCILLTAEATTQRILLLFYRRVGLKWEDFFPMGGTSLGKSLLFWILLAVLTFLLIVPAHLLLVRVEASLLPADERTIIPLHPVFSVAKQGRDHMTLIGAYKSLTRTSLINLIFLYVRIFFITAVTVALVGFVDFTWYLYIALLNWRF